MIDERRRRSRLALAMAGVALASFALGALTMRSCGGHEEGAAQDHAEPDQEIWTCSMHPQIRAEEPGLCPLCGMALIPVGGVDFAEARPDRVVLSERARALAKVRTTEVRRMSDPSAEIRLLGRVEADESTARTVTSWVAGRIDRLHVNVTGVRVRAGQTIATLYSPEILAAHQDLISARKQLDRLGSAGGAREAAEATLDAARDRLSLLGVPAPLLAELERAHQSALAPEALKLLFPGGIADGFTCEIWEFIECIRGNRPAPEVDGWEGLRSLAVCEAVYESAWCGEPVRVVDVAAGRVRAYQAPIDEHWGL